MSDPIVTRADLDVLRGIYRRLIPEEDYERDLLVRLIDAAEADTPPLPDGWVMAKDSGGARRVMWHQDGALWTYDDGSVSDFSFDYFKAVSPLRPTVTEADVERAAEAAWRKQTGNAATWNHLPELWLDIVRAAFAAAGIEVQP